VSVSGSGDGATPAIVGDGAGFAHVTGAASAALLALSASGSGTVAAHGVGAGDTPAIVGGGSGFFLTAGTGAGDLPKIAGVGSGGLVVTGTGAGDLPMMSGVGGDWPMGVASSALPMISGASTGWVGTAAKGWWLRVDTSPPSQIFAIDLLRGRLDPSLPSHRIDSVAPAAMQSQIGRVNESWAVVLTGCSQALRQRLVRQALYGVRVRLYDGATLLRDGITDGLRRKDRTIELSVQSDVWTRDLPVRTTADLGTYRDVEPIAWRYGRDVPGVLIALSNTRRRWIWADHASQAIRSITIDGQPMAGWSWRNDTDSTGRAITIVETVDPIDEGAVLVATGDGAIDSVTGSLIANPADVVYDLCQRAGRVIDRGSLARFRRDCLARNLELSNSIDSGSLQAAVESIASSVHAVFARSHPDMLRLLPITAAADGALESRYLTGIDGDAGDIATRLLVRYGREESGPRRSLEVRAAAVELAHGERPREIELPWVRDDRAADDVSTRMLADLARPSYRMTYAAQLRQWVPGEVATVDDADGGLSGAALVESVNGMAPVARLRIGPAPTITLATVSSAYVPEAYASATVTAQGSQRVVTIYDASGRAIVGARCTLDGNTVRTSDGAGRVSWSASLMGPGRHVIDVIADGMEPMQIEITL